MNIIAAIKSGKRFKREGWDKFHSKREYTIIDFETMLADDWEIEQTSVTITLDEFASAFATALDSFKKMELTMNDFYLKLTKELGL